MNPNYGTISLDRSHPRQSAAICLAVSLAVVAGCTDTRITMDELKRREAHPTRAESDQLQIGSLTLTELNPYRVGPGDVLNVTFTGLDGQYGQTTLRLRVHDDGTVVLPMVGKVKVSGMDLKAVEHTLYDAHVPSHVKHMSLFAQLEETAPTTAIVIGANGQSGLVTLPRNERNVLYALNRAAAFDPSGGSRVTVRPVRADRPEISYDLSNADDLRAALLAPPLESGDMILVEPTSQQNAIFVTGLVNTPTSIPVPKHGSLSLVRTLAAAGGLRDFLDPQEATLWRVLPDGEQVRVKLELGEVLAGNVPDIQLRPGDVLDVPHTADTRFREWVAANIRLGPFGVTAMYDPVADYRARILRDDRNNNIIRDTFLGAVGTGAADLIITPLTP